MADPQNWKNQYRMHVGYCCASKQHAQRFSGFWNWVKFGWWTTYHVHHSSTFSNSPPQRSKFLGFSFFYFNFKILIVEVRTSTIEILKLKILKVRVRLEGSNFRLLFYFFDVFSFLWVSDQEWPRIQKLLKIRRIIPTSTENLVKYQ